MTIILGLKLDKSKKNPVQYLSLTGFSPEDFEELATGFRIEWDQYSSHFTLEGKKRQRIALLRKTQVLHGVIENISITGTTGCDIFDDPASS